MSYTLYVYPVLRFLFPYNSYAVQDYNRLHPLLTYVAAIALIYIMMSVNHGLINLL